MMRAADRVLEGRRKEGEITIKKIAKDRDRLKTLGCLKSLRTRRDRYYAHFDKKYFFDLERLARETPIALKDFEGAVNVLWEIVTKYSAAYDSKSFEMTSSNINDLDHILYALREYKTAEADRYSE